MSMTIEWVLERIRSALVLRIDLNRSTITRRSGEEGVKAVMLCSFEDEEGQALVIVRYEAQVNGYGSITLKHSMDKSQWATMIGDEIAGWDEAWRVESDQVFRMGVPFKERPNPAWHSLRVGNELLAQKLNRLEGAFGQFVSQSSHMPLDVRHVLGIARDRLVAMIANRNTEASSKTDWL